MRRVLVTTITALTVLVALSLTAFALAASKSKKHKFTQTIVGATISSNGNKATEVYSIHSSLDGNGAGIQHIVTSGTTFPLSGKGRATTYYNDGVGKAKTSFTLSAPNADGISTIGGSGKCVGGTRKLAHEKCSFTFTGTYNTKTTVSSVKVTGTYSRP